VNTLAKQYRAHAQFRVPSHSTRCAPQRLLEQPLEYIYHSSFDDRVAGRDDPGRDAGTPRGLRGQAAGHARPPRDVPPELSSQYEWPLLSQGPGTAPVPADELPEVQGGPAALRGLTVGQRQRWMLAHAPPPRNPWRRSSNLQRQANDVKGGVSSAPNMRLGDEHPPSGTRPRRTQLLSSCLSDGNMSLIRAVEKFDFRARGFKFQHLRQSGRS